MDREPWRAAVHGVTKSWTWLSDWTELNFYWDSYSGGPKPRGDVPENETDAEPSSAECGNSQSKRAPCACSLRAHVLRHLSHSWPCDPMSCSPVGSSVHEGFSARAGVERRTFLQGIFPNQALNPCLLRLMPCSGFFTAEPLRKAPCSLHSKLLEPTNLLFFLKPVWVGSSIIYKPGYSPLRWRNWDTKTEVHLCQFELRAHQMCTGRSGHVLT